MKNNWFFNLIAIIIITSFVSCNSISKKEIEGAKELNYCATLMPDYADISIPVNIAPLNFKVLEKGDNFFVTISGDKGSAIEIANKLGIMSIDAGQWHDLLKLNKGDFLTFNVYVHKQDSGWVKYKTFKNFVETSPIDNFLVYRIINSGHVLWNEMGIYQRDLTSFDEKPLVKNSLINNGCVNCHSFWKNSPKKMLFHVRGENKGTMFLIDNKIEKVNTKTPMTMASAVYPAWHPNGTMVAFSVNRIRQSFHNYNSEPIEVYDKASDLILYDTKTNEITTSPLISTNGRETYPNWSPDGKYLYYCCSPKWDETIHPDSMRYSLLRIGFNAETKTWGKIDTIIDANKLRKSVTFPKVSPDGKYILLTLSNHGCFSIFYNSADLYLLDLSTNKLEKAELNSDQVESYHSWSSDGKWVVFSSKRLNNIHARPFISYFSNGHFQKPFVLPQKNPVFYESFLRNYNLPELITEPIDINPVQWADAILKTAKDASFDKNVNVDALSGASMIKK